MTVNHGDLKILFKKLCPPFWFPRRTFNYIYHACLIISALKICEAVILNEGLDCTTPVERVIAIDGLSWKYMSLKHFINENSTVPFWERLMLTVYAFEF